MNLEQAADLYDEYSQYWNSPTDANPIAVPPKQQTKLYETIVSRFEIVCVRALSFYNE